MLDITLLRRDLDGVLQRLQARKTPQPFLDVTRFQALEAERKEFVGAVQEHLEETRSENTRPPQLATPRRESGRGRTKKKAPRQMPKCHRRSPISPSSTAN